MPNVDSRVIRSGSKRTQMLFELTCGEKNENSVNVSLFRANPQTLSIFHEDYRMPNVVSIFSRRTPERTQTRLELTSGQKNKSLVNV